MGKYKNLSEFLTACMDAVRSKKGISTKIIGENLPDEIASIQAGGREPVIQSLTATKNGTYSVPSGVDGYSPVTVNVPIPKPVMELEYHTITIPADINSGVATYLSGVDFIKTHRNDPGFFALIWAKSPTTATGYVTWSYGGNTLIGQSASGPKIYAVNAETGSATITNFRRQTGKLNGSPEGYNACLITNASGNLYCYTGGASKVKAGDYDILLGVLP